MLYPFMNGAGHRLNAPEFLNPLVFNAICAGKVQPVVIDAQTVQIDGEQFTLEHPEEVQLTPGQTVYVTLNRCFFLETAEEREAREHQARETYQQREQEQREKERRRNVEAAAFNAQYQLPVAWVPGIKDVLSGLSETSDGTGWSRRTVVHILLQEDLRAPRLRREVGDFLCTSAKGSNGKNWSCQPEQIWRDSEGNTIQSKVTCQRCLTLAGRWKVEVSQ